MEDKGDCGNQFQSWQQSEIFSPVITAQFLNITFFATLMGERSQPSLTFLRIDNSI
jgi:hypothetical protein